MIVQLQCPHCKEIVEGERFDSDGHISDGAIATRARASASRALAEHVCLPVTAEKLLRREQLAAAMNDRHVFAFRDSDIEEEGFTSRLKKILGGPLFESMYRHRVPTPEETFTCDDELQRNRDMYDCSSIRVRSIDGAVFHVSVTPELVRQVNDAAAHRAAITKKRERAMAKLLDFGMPAYITKPSLMPTTETVPQVTYIIDKCECGAEAVGEPHYRWCPKHTK